VSYPGGNYKHKGPYGTNEGDIWAMGGPLGDRLITEDNKLGICEMFRDEQTGKVEERMYCVDLDNPDPEMQNLMTKARQGSMMLISAQASQN
jgi:hypothetical protein